MGVTLRNQRYFPLDWCPRMVQATSCQLGVNKHLAFDDTCYTCITLLQGNLSHQVCKFTLSLVEIHINDGVDLHLIISVNLLIFGIPLYRFWCRGNTLRFTVIPDPRSKSVYSCITKQYWVTQTFTLPYQRFNNMLPQETWTKNENQHVSWKKNINYIYGIFHMTPCLRGCVSRPLST